MVKTLQYQSPLIDYGGLYLTRRPSAAASSALLKKA